MNGRVKYREKYKKEKLYLEGFMQVNVSRTLVQFLFSWLQLGSFIVVVNRGLNGYGVVDWVLNNQ